MKAASRQDRAMLLNLAEELHLEASPEDVWKLLRDTPRFAGLLPGVESVKALDEADGGSLCRDGARQNWSVQGDA